MQAFKFNHKKPRLFDEEISIRNLYELTSILTKHNIIYWLQDGTLLGYVREKKLISHDKDTDLGLFWDDIKDRKDIIKEIINLGFKISKIKGYMKESLLLTFTKDGQSTDFFFYYHSNNKIYHCATGKKWQIYQYYYEPFNVKKVNFLNYTFLVPENELKFIETKYGKDWQTPKPKWRNITDPVNATETENFIDIKKGRKEFKTWLKK
jgi:hypothetical protein